MHTETLYATAEAAAAARAAARTVTVTATASWSYDLAETEHFGIATAEDAEDDARSVIRETSPNAFTWTVTTADPAPQAAPQAAPQVWVAVVEWGEDYGDREPGITVATTEAAARAGAAADVWDFLNAVADPEPCMTDFIERYGALADAADPVAWLDAMRLDSDVPAFLTVEQRPIV